MRRWIGVGCAMGAIWALGALGQAVAQEPAPAVPEPAPAPVEVPVAVRTFTTGGSVQFGERASVRGTVSGSPTRVLIERLDGEEWAQVATLRADARGRFSARLPLRRSATLRASAVGADGVAVPGPRKNLRVLRKVHLKVTVPEYESVARRPFTVSGAVVPARNGERVVLEGSRDGGKYAPVARLTVRNGRVSAKVSAPSGGMWRFRIATGTSTEGGPSTSAATAPRRVFGSNPHGVPSSAPRYLVQAISEMHLYYYEHGQVVRVLPVVFGKPSTPTPVGNFRVYSKTVGPGPAFGPLAIWYHGNYGIHGTNQEYLLKHDWRYYSKGCTRNYNDNIRWLWDRVPVGTPVRNIR